MVLNGKPLERLYLTHAEIMQGGTLTFFMSGKPVKK
jgi:putative alpha-1,2-mannosidase